MKINKRVESILSHAVALNQSGRLRNTVYCVGKRVYVINQDHTILMRFGLRESEVCFVNPASFDASDYDSQELRERDGRIEFVQREGKYVRTKSCKTPRYAPEDVEQLFRSFGKPKGRKTSLSSDILRLLDEGLSHVEFSAKGRLKIIQRNIYTGAIIEVKREDSGLFAEEGLDFGPIGMRTNDFMSLYSFVGVVSFWFEQEDVVHFASSDPKMDMRGVIGQCIYDELGGELSDGRKK